MGTQDQYHHLSIWPNEKYGHKLPFCTAREVLYHSITTTQWCRPWPRLRTIDLWLKVLFNRSQWPQSLSDNQNLISLSLSPSWHFLPHTKKVPCSVLIYHTRKCDVSGHSFRRSGGIKSNRKQSENKKKGDGCRVDVIYLVTIQQSRTHAHADWRGPLDLGLVLLRHNLFIITIM